jgi:aspartate-semialdehyde dehydrogenase
MNPIPATPENTRIWVVGATGLVGRHILDILLTEWKIAARLIRPVASPKRVGHPFHHTQASFVLQGLEPETWEPQFDHWVLLATEADVSRQWVETLLPLNHLKVTLIDASSAYRLNPEVPLIIPELNGKQLDLEPRPRIIASPNCATIGLLLGISPFWKAGGVRRLFVSSYQAASGAGFLARQSLAEDHKHETEKSGVYFPFPLANNCIPQIGAFKDHGYCQEELKVVAESHKILRSPLPIHVTTARIPVANGHSESVTLEYEHPLSHEQVQTVIAQHAHPDIRFANPLHSSTSLGEIQNTNRVLVSRVRIHPDDPCYLHCWIQFDNLRVGAATNVCRILGRMIR